MADEIELTDEDEEILEDIWDEIAEKESKKSGKQRGGD
jgi:hypothetical protein